MNKYDLNSGMLVELANGTKWLVVGSVLLKGSSACLELSRYTDDLKYNCDDTFDIVKVYDIPKCDGMLYLDKSPIKSPPEVQERINRIFSDGLKEGSIKLIYSREIEKPKEEKINDWSKIIDKEYYFINEVGNIDCRKESNTCFDDVLHNIGNYNTNKRTMKRIAFTQELSRELERFRDENDKGKVDWKNLDNNNHAIYFDYFENKFDTYNTSHHLEIGVVYFSNEKVARKALKEFKEDFEILKKYYME